MKVPPTLLRAVTCTCVCTAPITACIDAVKSELMRGRGVTVAFEADMAAPGEVAKNPMMNEDTWAHYTYEDLSTNHEVCIVGWDDDYPASNFVEGHLPPGDGAWLVKNSRGSEYDYTELEDGVLFSIAAEESVTEDGTTIHEYATNVAYSKVHAEAVKEQEAADEVSGDERNRIADEYGVAVVNKGESFIFEDRAWCDWSEYAPRTRALEDYAIDNFSIKAYLLCKAE